MARHQDTGGGHFEGQSTCSGNGQASTLQCSLLTPTQWCMEGGVEKPKFSASVTSVESQDQFQEQHIHGMQPKHRRHEQERERSSPKTASHCVRVPQGRDGWWPDTQQSMQEEPDADSRCSGLVCCVECNWVASAMLKRPS